MTFGLERLEGDHSAVGRARLALEGLSVGDAFGERFFGRPETVEQRIRGRVLPARPWFWTDDTAMGIAVYETLRDEANVDQASLARRFGERYRLDPRRGYGATAHDILPELALGRPWREIASAAFDGQGSMGNGAAMRAAPVGAFFADDLEKVVAHARASAEPTHAHPEGQAGAIAVAVAASLAWKARSGSLPDRGATLLREVVLWTPAGATREGIQKALSIPLAEDPRVAASVLGNGSQVTAPDTVPFSLWCAARHLDHFEEALWVTVSGLGDRDTTCAIVGGIVALSVGYEGLPASMVDAREPLESTLTQRERYETMRDE